MTMLVAMVRRSLWLVLLAAAGGATYSWWRDRNGDPALAPPEWPPLGDPAGAGSVTSGAVSSIAPTPSDSTPSASNPTSTASSIVNALVDAPEARSTDGEVGGWVDALDDGSCPLSHPIKANDNSGIFHVPGGRFYDRTKPERCYTSADAAIADGYRQAKN
jgi:hypothetical protein